MNMDLGTLVAHMRMDHQQFTNGLAQVNTSLNTTQGVVTRIGQSFRTAFTMVGIYAAVRTLGTFKNAARDAEESENLFTVALGENEEAARRWSEQYATSLRLNAYETRQTLGVFFTMLEAMGMVEDDARKMAQSLTSLANDIASFYNLKTQDAFQKLQAGITGEIEPLKRLGIVVNETTIKAYAMRKGWIKQGEALSETQKVYARYNVIAEQTRKAQGDMARTMGDLANVERQTQAAWQESKIILGQSLLPVYKTTFSTLRDLLTENQREIKRWGSDFSEGVDIVVDAMNRLNTQTTSAQARFNRFGEATKKSIQEAYKSQTGQTFGMTTGVAPGVMGGAAITTWREPQDIEYFHRLLDSYERALQRRETLLSGPLVSAPTPSLTLPEMEPPEGTTDLAADAKRAKANALEIAQAYARMSKELSSQSQAGWEARQRILEEEHQRFKDLLGDKSEIVDEWYREQVEKARIEGAKIGNSFAAGFKAWNAHADRTFDSVGARAFKFAEGMEESLNSGFVNMLMDMENWKQHVLSILDDILRSWLRLMVVEPMVRGMMGGFGTGGQSPGTPYGPQEYTPSAQFVPQLAGTLVMSAFGAHAEGGLVTQPHMALVGEAGPELIIPWDELSKPAKEPVFNVEVHNQTSTPIAASNIHFDPKNMVMSVLLKDERNRGPIYRQTRRR